MINELQFKDLINAMGKHAQMEYPNEVCGIVTTNWEYIPCKNLSPSPKDSYVLDPIALLEHEDIIYAIFHSHAGDENPLPSEADFAHTVFDCYKFIVGFNKKFYIYWYDKRLKVLKYDELKQSHFEC